MKLTGWMHEPSGCCILLILLPRRNQIIIYDLKKDVRFSLTPTWDRSPGSIVVSATLYMRCFPG